VERYRPRIEERAYVLSQARRSGDGDARSDWMQAEVEVLRTVLLYA
jgi:hypothetical protein